MSDIRISELFLFPNYKIIVFHGASRYYTVKGSHVCYGNYESKNADAVETNFMNDRINVSNCKMLGKLSELTDEKCNPVFKEARYSEKKYPNFQDPDGEKLDSSLESIKSYLKAEGWNIPEDKTWIIIPKPAKKLVGKHMDIEFYITTEEFTHGLVKKILPVYMSSINTTITEINYSVEVPDFLYDYLMLHPQIENRPKSKVFTSNMFSQVLSHISNLSSTAIHLYQTDKEEKKARKVILVSFGSSQSDQRDSYQFGYIGKETFIKYQYYIGYTFVEGLNNKTCVCVDKRYEQGKGFVTIPTTQRRIYIGDNRGFKTLEWTQEREDFLNMIEINFKKLSDNLNNYLKDLDGDKLDLLISNGTKLLS